MSVTPIPIYGGTGVSNYLTKINTVATLPCARCGNNQFSMEKGFFAFSVAEQEGQVALGGQVIPAVAVVCMRCGMIYFHATALLKR